MQAFQGYVENGKIIPVGMPRIPDGLQVIITVLDNTSATRGMGHKPLTDTEIDSMLENSVTCSLLGSIPNTNISLEEIRMERLSKYERSD